VYSGDSLSNGAFAASQGIQADFPLAEFARIGVRWQELVGD